MFRGADPSDYTDTVLCKFTIQINAVGHNQWKHGATQHPNVSVHNRKSKPTDVNVPFYWQVNSERPSGE